MTSTRALHTAGAAAQSKGSRKRNMWVDLWRFIACLIIMVFHYLPENVPVNVVSGGLMVEFFFLLSGYFALLHMRRVSDEADVGQAVLTYMKRFYLRTFPYVASGVALIYAHSVLLYWHDKSELVKHFLMLPFDLLLLQSTGMYESSAAILWYLSIIMLCLPIILYASKRLKNVWLYVVTVVPMLCYGYLILKVGTLRYFEPSRYVWVRACGGLLLGGLMLELGDRLKAMELKGIHRVALLAVEILSLLMAMFLITRPSLDRTYFDTVTVFCLFLSFTICLSGTTATSEISIPVIGDWLGDLSLCVYCLHRGMFRLVRELGTFASRNRFVVTGYICTLVLSVVLVAIVRAARARKRKAQS